MDETKMIQKTIDLGGVKMPLERAKEGLIMG